MADFSLAQFRSRDDAEGSRAQFSAPSSHAAALEFAALKAVSLAKRSERSSRPVNSSGFCTYAAGQDSVETLRPDHIAPL